MVTRSGHVKLMDFGLARHEAISRLTVSGAPLAPTSRAVLAGLAAALVQRAGCAPPARMGAGLGQVVRPIGVADVEIAKLAVSCGQGANRLSLHHRQQPGVVSEHAEGGAKPGHP